MSKLYDQNVSIEELFPDDDMTSHVLDSSDMWAGTKEAVEQTDYIVENGQPVLKTFSYSPALYKCGDEAIVNALDHMIRMYEDKATGDNLVTQIDIELDSNGTFSVKNNGRGVPTGWHKKAKMHAPQFIFGTMFKGRAKNDRAKKVTGDANRVGIKIANIMSKKFTIETVYNGQLYVQNWSNNMRQVDPPTITETELAQYTKVTFEPEYNNHFPAFDPILIQLFEFRAWQTAAYAGFYTNGNCKVSYNGKPINIPNMKTFANLMFPMNLV